MARSDTVVAVVGPTATGKSDMAVQIALRHDGEIVERGQPPHLQGHGHRHGQATAGAPGSRASPFGRHRGAGRALQRRALSPAGQAGLFRTYWSAASFPIVAGGSGQYVWGLLEGWQIPDAASVARAEGGARSSGRVRGWRGPVPRACRVGPGGRRAHTPTQCPAGHQGAGAPPDVARKLSVALRKVAPPFNPVIVGLMLARAELYRRIDARVDAMIDAGWLDEVRALMDRGCPLDLPSMSSLGYSEIGRSPEGARWT